MVEETQQKTAASLPLCLTTKDIPDILLLFKRIALAYSTARS